MSLRYQGGLKQTGTAKYSTETVNPFTIPDVGAAELNSEVISDVVSPSGFTMALPISATNGATISVNGGSYVSSTTISPGQTFTVKITSSLFYETLVSTIVTIGSTSSSWSVTTKLQPILTSSLVSLTNSGTTTFITYSINEDSFTKLSDPSTLPTTARGLGFSPLGNVILVGAQDASNTLRVYEVDDSTVTHIGVPALIPDPLPFSIDFNPDGTLAAIASSASPSVGNAAYSVSGTTLTKLTIASTISAQTNGVSFNHDGTLCSFAAGASPYIHNYSISGTTFTKLSNPASLPTANGMSCRYSPDGSLLVVGLNSSPWLKIYSVSGTTYTAESNPASLPTGAANDIAFSPDGTLMAVAHSTSPYLTIYSVSGTTFTKISDGNISVAPAGNSNGVDFNSDGTLLGVTHNTSPFVSFYVVDGTNFNKISDSNIDTLPTGIGRKIKFSPN